MKDWVRDNTWVVRRGVYVAVVVVAVVLVQLGVIPQEVADANVDKIANTILGLVLVFAATKTGPGSDDPTTKKDLDQAQAVGVSAAPQAADLAGLIGPMVGEQVQQAVRDVYMSPYGKHDAEASEMVDGSGYPG